ncbi:Heterogeneous nuclear ribonucleoprotein [Mycena indigotica]|uniref:Heterogeneous nuclear ribonucleoprotein n=1 Tax=Mycena indigotica TaxID=2126181 RepID=A0A8H6SK82_9AGAR|nr:Heterogeneous nuclear ribonucleoprotein [Mycena indigotica]KAF7301153.1 Heterogeneous nuclear ribonucleoprotein [Mycena indigotica]
MSDLDADLYGDLYGNDETEFDPTQGNVDATEPEPLKPDAKPTPAAVAPKPVPAATVQPPRPAVTGQPIATFSSVTQQIPTYEQPQTNDYRGGGISSDGAYHGGGERSVRPSEMKDEGKMFIGGLNWDTTDDGLRDYFSQFGKVDACTIMRDAAGRSRCFAFLTFDDPASVNAVMVREHVLDGKIIDPKRAIPRQEHQRATKLFIGGLAGSVTSESMRAFFSQFGKVIDSTVMLDRETGRSKGFGFVSFEDTDVQPFLGFGNLEIDGKLIDVKLAQPRYQRDNFSEDNPTGAATTNFNAANNFSGNGQAAGNFSAGAGTPFDPQALAALYTRMFQMAGGGGGMGMMGNAMGNGMGNGMGMMGMGGMMAGMGRGMGMTPGMGRGTPPVAPGGGPGPNVPRGPRAQTGNGPPTGPMAGNAGVGPQRVGVRGQHNYHPYAR